VKVLVLLVALVTCGDNQLPTCESLGCKGAVLCKSPRVCMCSGKLCRAR
jgi:hypothetical protein